MSTRLSKVYLDRLVLCPLRRVDELERPNTADIQHAEKYGLIHPVVVRSVGQNYEVIAGEKTWFLAQELKLDCVPVYVRDDIDDDDVAGFWREGRPQPGALEAMAQAEQLQAELQISGISLSVFARQKSKSRSTLAHLLRLAKLSVAVKALLAESPTHFSVSHLKALASLAPHQQLLVARRVIRETLSSKATEKLVRGLGKNTDPQPARESGTPKEYKPFIDALSDALQSEVFLDIQRGVLEIHYCHNNEILDGIAERLALNL